MQVIYVAMRNMYVIIHFVYVYSYSTYCTMQGQKMNLQTSGLKDFEGWFYSVCIL